ncbi:MAG TPA: hypothetical protein VHV51_05980 [Polyangiaceae bacterium]|nr:hypothetical protein [Polyangiaceae bacterium]
MTLRALALGICLTCIACGSSDSGGGSSGSGGSANIAGSGAGGASGGSQGAIDTTTCAVCDAAAKCCTAAIGLSSCNAYSTSGCEKDMDPADQAEVINACAVEYNATKGTPGCK